MRSALRLTHPPLAVRQFSYRHSYLGREENIPRARADLEDALEKIGFDPLLAGDVLVCVSELATNAIRHALRGSSAGTFLVAAQLRGRRAPRLRVEVHDPLSSTAPQLPPPAPEDIGLDAESGRGLCLVDALSLQCGCERAPGRGKAVWCELRAYGAPLEGHAQARTSVM